MSAMAIQTTIMTTDPKPNIPKKDAERGGCHTQGEYPDSVEEHYVGHRRQSTFDRLSDTYSPSITKFGPDRANSRDHSRGKSHPHGRDSPSRDRPRSRDSSRGVEESYDHTRSSYGIRTEHGYRSCNRNRSRYVKRGRKSESLLSRVSESSTSDGGHWKSKSKRHRSTDEDDLAVPWICEEVDPFTPRIRNFKSSRKT
ncbi:hypothetical protein Tco_1506419 [Tanacetum coccineum]